MLGWGNWVQGLEAMGKHELPCFIHRVCTAVCTVHKNSPMLKMSYTQGVESKAGWVLGDGDEGAGDHRKGSPMFSMQFFCQFQTSMLQHRILLMRGRGGRTWQCWDLSICLILWIGLSLDTFPDLSRSTAPRELVCRTGWWPATLH